MAVYTINRIAQMMHGKPAGDGKENIIDHILTDSRKLVFPERTLFFALEGSRRDGHLFIADLYQKGVRGFVVNKSFDIANYTGAGFIVVHNTLDALQVFVSSHRQQFNCPVIGITGSNGKTIVKEWLNHLLQSDYNIVRSPKSYNSQIGVPLSVWQMNENHQLGIFEAGISQPGEMEMLEKIIHPSIGILTNIGEAHSEGFINRHQKIREKLKLFIHCRALVYCRDDAELNAEVISLKANLKRGLDNNLQLFDWSRKPGATLQVTHIVQTKTGSIISAIYKSDEIQISIPFSDAASVENAVHCWCLLLYMGIKNEEINEQMMTLPHVAMRLEMKAGINRCSIINDSYSADLSSLNIALDFLLQQQQHQKHTVILSDILESGKQEKELYRQVANALKQKKVNRLIGIGQDISHYRHVFDDTGLDCSFYSGTTSFLEQFHPSQFRDESILLKGARVFEFERISKALEQKIHQTVLEINLSAITHNLKQYQQLLKPETKLMVMVKAFSYGSGTYEIANLLQFHKVDYLAVAYADEGVELRKSGISLPIMVMNAEENSFGPLTEYSLQPEMYSFDILRAFDAFLKSEGITDFPVHIKMDTGMHRLGFETKETDALCQFLTATASFRVQTVFTHLASSEDPLEDDYTKQQAAAFTASCNTLEKQLGYKFIRHAANTAAIVRHPALQMDMVRLGIGLYGIDSAASGMLDLKQVSSLKTTVAQIKKVKAGDTVGYNRKGKVERDSVIATIRLGYADGYPRRLSNGRGKVIIHGKPAPVTGNVCMDMTMVDISNVPEVKTGDEVIVFGNELPVTQLAQWAETIPYEIMTGISQRVKRVYFEE